MVENQTKEKELYFNPRPRKEGDVCVYVIIFVTSHFNPRPRKEGDIEKTTQEENVKYFNPRPRKEGDITTDEELMCELKFQSTPSQRGRQVALFVPVFPIVYFNPRPRKEGDRWRCSFQYFP